MATETGFTVYVFVMTKSRGPENYLGYDTFSGDPDEWQYMYFHDMAVTTYKYMCHIVLAVILYKQIFPL